MNKPIAVRIQSPAQYITVCNANKEQGFKPFEIGQRFQTGYLSIEENYVFVGAKYMDNYELISFEDFLRMEVVSC